MTIYDPKKIPADELLALRNRQRKLDEYKGSEHLPKLYDGLIGQKK